MTSVMLEKKLGGLYPARDDAYRVLNKLRNGEKVVADVRSTARRSGAQHRFFFALINTLFESQEYYKTLNHFRQCLLIHLGYCDIYWIRSHPGTRVKQCVPIAKSLKFSKMTSEEFGGLVDATLNFAEGMGFDRAELLSATREYAA